MSKYCNKCKQWKSEDMFGSDAHQYDGKSCYCRECINIAQNHRNALKRQGRSATLARFTNEELLNELRFRMLCTEEDIARQ